MQVLETLQNIASHVHIESSDFRISHSNFPPVEFSTATVAQLHKMSPEVQYKCLNLQLLNLIHSIYYEGSLAIEASQEFKTNNESLQKIASAEVDWEFYEQLDRNNAGKCWFHPDYRVVGEEADGSLAVKYDGVILHIQQDRHLQLADQSATVDDLVAVWSSSRCILHEFYMAIGDAAGDFGHPANYLKQAVFVYFNFSPETAIAAMKCVTRKLNAIKIPFTFKVLWNPLIFGRYDSGILRFDNDNYEVVWEVLQTIYAENKYHFQPHVPLFTKVLAPGIGLAEHPCPELQFRHRENFGINRCQIVANALMEAHKNGAESKEARMTYILKYFDHFGIDLERPYLNPNSQDIYTPLA